jgi:acylphosphatase
MKHIKVSISGKVQGVFFRASTKAKADELGVKGFVRNEPDNRVYIEAEASEDVLKLFVAWCHEGPRLAKVDQVEVTEGEYQGFMDFSISR